MIVLELFIAILQFVLNLLLAICMIPFVPVVWVIREIKGVTPVTKNTFMNLPKLSLGPKKEKNDE